LIKKEVLVKIIKNKAVLKEPLIIYQGDYGIELSFQLLRMKYKYSNSGENWLERLISDDILEAYTTIVNPLGEELTQQNGEVKDNTIRFIITKDLTDELTEIGVYKIQFHICCKHSEATIPEIEFSVLERLKGGKSKVFEAIVGTAVVGKSRIEYE
jgi:hypothetical protein